MVKKQENADLEALQNDGVRIKVGDEEIHIKPFTFGQLLKALKHLGNLLSTFAGTEEINDALIIQALAYNADDVLGLLMLSTGKSKEFFDDLDPEKGIDLAIATWNVNQDFFVSKLGPKIQQLQESSNSTEKTKKKESKTGSTSSNN